MNTHIVMVVDQSGSMEPIKPDTIGSYNQYLAEQRSAALAGDSWTLTLFSSDIQIATRALPVRDVPNLTPETYRPSGNTALLDAIAETVAATETRISADDRVLFVVITDGQENASTKATKPDVQRLIAEKEASGNWSFVYLGANVDAFAEAGALGIGAGNTLTYAGTGAGTQTAYQTLNQATATYRASVSQRSASFFSGAPIPPPADSQQGKP